MCAPAVAGFSLNVAAAVMWEVGFIDAVLELICAELMYSQCKFAAQQLLYTYIIYIALS